MKKLLLLSALGLAVMMPATSQAAAVSDSAAAVAAGKALPDTKHRPRCSACFTCGGSFPVFSGSLRIPSPSLVVERGTQCNGSPRTLQDSIPFICCNRG